MSNPDILKKYIVNDDGTLTPATISTMSDLSDNKVYIVVDETMRKIFIWKGESAPVRRKFISAKAAQQMRAEEYGMVYRIESLDPGLEGQDFLAIFGGAASPSTPSTQEPTPTTVPRSAPAAAPSSVPRPTPTTVPKTTTAPRTTPKPAPSPRIVRETEIVVTEPVKTEIVTIEEVTSKIADLEIPQTMEREIIIVGNTVFSVIKEHLALFSKDVVKLEPMHDLPSGIFPADHYQVRLFIEEGRVLFTEMLRQKTRSERDEFVDDMKKSLQDLSKMGL